MQHLHKRLAAALLTLTTSLYSADSWSVNDPDLFAGDVLQFLVPIAALGVTYHFDDSQGAWQLGKTWGGTMLATETLKYSLANTSWGERPNGGKRSFPSGHTASACAGAFFLQERYGWKWGVPGLAAAVFTGSTRVDEHMHHVRDVVVGCALAWGAAKLFVTEHGSSNFMVTPGFEGKSASLSFDWRF